jgi:hypothetical protein
LEVKVAKHFIAAPPTDQADYIGINVGTKQGQHAGPGGAKGTCRDISGKETEGGAQESDSGFESVVEMLVEVTLCQQPWSK